MNPINNGGAAFPTEIGPGDEGGFQSGNERWHEPGMSLRDYLAAEVLPAVLSVGWRDMGFTPKDGLSIMENNALCAYQQADAALKVRQS